MERDVMCGEIRLRLTDEGEGPPVLLLHGFPDSRHVWRHQIPALVAAGYRVLAPDLRGYGDSDRPEGVEAYGVGKLIADVAGLLDGLAVEAAHLIGHDWGAGLGWALATALPDRVLSLAALSVGHPQAMAVAGIEQREKSWYFLLFQFAEAEALLTADNWALFRAHNREDPEAIAAIAAMAKSGALTAALNWYRANVHPAMWGQGAPMAAVQCRTFGLWSDGDPFLTELQMTGSAAHVTGPWRYQRIEGAGHWLQVDQSDQINAMLVAWLRDILFQPGMTVGRRS